ncbi:hypothetical protein EU519_01435, partial [Candidatus Thorarchaeota archaeon]
MVFVLKLRKMVGFILVLLLFVIVTPRIIYRSNVRVESAPRSRFTPSDLQISILSNADFAGYASEGDGSEGSPWVISDYVGSNGMGEIINIEGTTDYFIIEDCVLDGINKQFESIFLLDVQNGEIRNCTTKNNKHCIFVSNGCSNIYIHDNIVFASEESGIRINQSEYITVANNTVYNHEYNGIWFRDSPHTYAYKNTVYDCETGIWAFDCGTNSACEIINNTVYGCDNAIYLNATTHAVVQGNYVFDETLASPNLTGLYLLNGASNNTITNNTIFQSEYHGLLIDSTSHNNTIKHNCFVSNNNGLGKQALDNGTDNIVDYNFWDDWISPDEDPADGIVDDPYILDGSGMPYPPSDPHPVTSSPTEVPFHYLVTPEVIYPNGGELINASATIHWRESLDTLGHSVNYSVYYSPNNGADWYEVVTNTTETSCNWDTAALMKGGGYLVKVIAKCSEGLQEEDVSDGNFTLQ